MQCILTNIHTHVTTTSVKTEHFITVTSSLVTSGSPHPGPRQSLCHKMPTLLHRFSRATLYHTSNIQTETKNQNPLPQIKSDQNEQNGNKIIFSNSSWIQLSVEVLGPRPALSRWKREQKRLGEQTSNPQVLEIYYQRPWRLSLWPIGKSGRYWKKNVFFMVYLWFNTLLFTHIIFSPLPQSPHW